ncbi:MAG TPA: Na+:solute symporter [Candidatus Sumerlaeota bacterium]|mgnify:FL=1|nr:Na+:solute symporter [Candidatus Sumerlaeota bacterium]
METQTTAMVLTRLDIWVIAIYIIGMAAIGIGFGGRAGKSLEEFFISGRSLPWWLAGTSMVATTFAADTPLAVTGMVIKDGIAGNWVWWAMAVGGMLTVFMYARLWRRSRVITDVELIELRYSGPEASFLRAFRAIYLAILMNCLIVGWVSNAMIKVLNVTLQPDKIPAFAPALNSITASLNSMFHASWSASSVANILLLLLLMGVTGLFSAVSGMWGVSVTDFIMFWIAMFGCIALAIFSLKWVGGISGLKGGLVNAYGAQSGDVLRFLPNFSADKPLMELSAFFVFIGVTWWASWYPGAEPGGGGYVVQRMASCKDEKHSLLATLWFTIAHYGIRPWPWIIVALVAAVKFPHLIAPGADANAGFPMVMSQVLPPGWRGLMLVAFFAAFMSTISTQINWGASYVVNDFYKRFIKPDATAKHYTRVSRLSTILILFLGTIISFKITSVEGAWKLMLTIGAGTGVVFLLRWYWWRINAWSEISSMVASLAIALFLIYGFKYPMNDIFDYIHLLGIGLGTFAVIEVIALWTGAVFPALQKSIKVTAHCTVIVMALVMILYLIHPVELKGHHQILITAFSTLLVWLSVTYLTPAVEEKRLVDFYRRVRPGGAGWAPLRLLASDVVPDKGIAGNLACWILGVIVVYSFLFGIGKIILGYAGQGIGLIAIGVISGTLMFAIMSKTGWEKVLK